MGPSRYASSRQKSCQQCSTAKARCDRKSGRCTRCTQRGLSCVYPQLAHGTDESITSHDTGHYSQISLPNIPFPSPGRLSINTPGSSPTVTGGAMASAVNASPDQLDFTGLDLICPINVDDISNRWLNPYIPVPEQTIKQYPPNVTRFICQILKSYAAAATRGRGMLPFIHPAQMAIMEQPANTPIATCLSLIRICETPLPGSEDAAATILQREMERITDLREIYDDMSLLAAFQAYLIYSMVLFFRLDQRPNPFFRQAMMNLQGLACSSSQRGLVCRADQHHARPRWEEWIVTEAKRRTLYVMYLFDSILSAQESLPTFLGTELQGLPAPANKSLWQAQCRSDWEKAYNVYLAEWTENGLAIDELWPTPADLDEANIAQRRLRVDRWVENIDEFGTMLYAVVSCTHGT
ncbi:hypothetical protein N7474_009961 [Penicillium riverlandense]|uniref:uncharacterized protein n=1 Tax=Penicillium riverlandense TaxID=1903569 RepID=UPI00254663D1|nr:uncharacterized protein N7474_009961 [Penicillium riverlandense]KAJ5808692.1 hypothetical protein N7474_009961 [Penicillium riverlandense]